MVQATSPQRPTPIRKTRPVSRHRHGPSTPPDPAAATLSSAESSPVSATPQLSLSPLAEPAAAPSEIELSPPQSIPARFRSLSHGHNSHGHGHGHGWHNRRGSSKRRSSSLAGCMLKDRSFWRPTGFDSDGWETYSVQLTESQGFRWNRTLYDMVDDVAFEDVFD